MNSPGGGRNLPRPDFTMRCVLFLTALLFTAAARADDGYRLWLRYDPISEPAPRAAYVAALKHLVLSTPTGADSPTTAVARAELAAGLRGLLGAEVSIVLEKSAAPIAVDDEGYALTHRGGDTVVISAHRDLGTLYGAFALLRHLQLHQPLAHLSVTSAPKIQRRLLNHWDDLNRFVERGYAGASLWEWFQLPEYRNPRYRDYARALASLGLNGAVLNNVNANALILTPRYLERVAALAPRRKYKTHKGEVTGRRHSRACSTGVLCRATATQNSQR